MLYKELVVKKIKEINSIIYSMILTILLLILSLIIILIEGTIP